MKECSSPNCNGLKKLSEFHVNKSKKDGHSHYCKDCTNRRQKIVGKNYRTGQLSKSFVDQQTLIRAVPNTKAEQDMIDAFIASKDN